MTPLAVHFAVRPVLPLFWCALVAAGFVALVGLILWRRWPQVSPRRQRILLVLRAAVVAAVLLLLFRPEISWQTRRAVPGQIAFLLDASRSMTIRDADQSPILSAAKGGDSVTTAREPLSRASALRRAFLDAAGPCADLARSAVVRSFAFGARLRPAANFAPDPVDPRTDPGEALADLADRTPPGLLAVVLAGDGAANRAAHGSPESAAARLLERGIRVHTVAVGSPEPSDRVRDVAVRDLRCPQRVFVGNRPEVRAAVSALGMKGRPVRLVLKADGREIARQDFTPDNQSAAREVVFTPTLADPGLVRLELEAEPVEGELVAENNSAATLLRVEEGGIRVLYLDGALRPEGKFLARALAEADEIDLERRVLVGPGAPSAAPNPDDLERFEVVVLGDLSPAAVPTATLARLSERVREGRLALVALGGSLAFGAGGWDKTPVADLLPFAIRAGDARVTAPLRFVPTPAGRRHFILNLAAAPPAVQSAIRNPQSAIPPDAFDKLPPLSGANIVGPLQPGAVLLAAAPDPDPNPNGAGGAGAPGLLAVRDTGVFRTAAFTADSTWLWVLSAADPQGPDRHARFWRGLVLWAARRDEVTPGRADLAVLTDRLRYWLADPDPGAPGLPAVRATVYARAAGDVPRLRLTAPDGRTRDLALTSVREGEWQAELQPDAPGTWCLRAEIPSPAVPSAVQSEIRNPKSEISPAAQTEFVVLQQDFEMTTLLADHDALRRTAEAGGGTFRTIDLLGDLFKELAQADMQVFEPVERRWPFASGRVFLAVVVALLSADWLLRRRWLLA